MFSPPQMIPATTATRNPTPCTNTVSYVYTVHGAATTATIFHAICFLEIHCNHCNQKFDPVRKYCIVCIQCMVLQPLQPFFTPYIFFKKHTPIVNERGAIIWYIYVDHLVRHKCNREMRPDSGTSLWTQHATNTFGIYTLVGHYATNICR